MTRLTLPSLLAALVLALVAAPNAAMAAPKPRVAAVKPAPAAPVDAPEAVININEATAEQLTFLPGIGESKAERIVAFRAKHAFKTPAELARVRGIGLKTVRKLKTWLRVSGPTTLSGPVQLPREGVDTSAETDR